MTDAVSTASTYVVFRLGSEHYALPVTAVVSIIRYEQPTPVPKAPAAVLGVVNLRGRVLPVVDLGRRFGGAAYVAGPLSRIVVTEGAAGTVGVAVDSASEVTTFSSEQIRPVPESVLGPETAHAFVGMVERESGLVMLLDPDDAMPVQDFSAVSVSTRNAAQEEGNDV